jgi:crotonobetainyl-CoA:carnitine CoA-transferase CaiB-like acyl-CoA transferase
VPSGPINTIPEALADPQAAHRGTLVDVPHPAAGKVRQIANPMRFSAAAIAYDRPPPLLGEHTAEILRDIGVDPASIESLRQNGVI